MRLKPPKTNKNFFTPEEFKDYILNHSVIEDGKSYSVIELWKSGLEEMKKEDAIEYFLTLWPVEYRKTVRKIFLEIE